jgi:hypothetical protein
MNEKLGMNAQIRAQFVATSSLSWIATAIVAFSCTLLAPAFVRGIPIFANMFRQLQVELPWPTRFLFATYYWVLPILFTALAVFVIWKELSARELRRKFLLTARVFIAALLTVGLVMFVLYLPVLTLASKLAITK